MDEWRVTFPEHLRPMTGNSARFAHGVSRAGGSAAQALYTGELWFPS